MISTFFLVVGCICLGAFLMFMGLVIAGHRPPPPPPGKTIMLVHHRHEVHHHGLPTDTDLPGDEWKKG